MKPAAELVAQVLERTAGLPGRNALVLGDAEPWKEALAAHGFDVRVARDLEHLELPEQFFDLAVAVGVLESTPWDRWALQQTHRAVKDGGRLVLAAPNFRALTSPGDLAFLGRRAMREVAARTRARLGLAPARDSFRGRRYRLPDLERMLESLGFGVRERATLGFGWLSPVASAARTAARIHLLTCERVPSRIGSDARRPYPDPAAHRRSFERTHGRFHADRERWLERYPRFRPAAIATFQPEAWPDARVLVLAPHPDDELIGCGGILAHLIDHGARVTVVHATDGSEAASLWHARPEVRRTVRLDEARVVAGIMGFDSLVFWREDNSAFRVKEDRVVELAQRIESERPTMIFTPFVTDIHPDHRVLCRMLGQAIARLPADSLADTRVLSYQVWSLLPPNLVCDVTDAMDRIERALLAYVTAMKVDDYVHFCEDRNYYDSVTLTSRQGFVEAFFQTTAADYPQLVATIEDSHA